VIVTLAPERASNSGAIRLADCGCRGAASAGLMRYFEEAHEAYCTQAKELFGEFLYPG
jgi:hypothetical protein